MGVRVNLRVSGKAITSLSFAERKSSPQMITESTDHFESSGVRSDWVNHVGISRLNRMEANFISF